MNKVRPVYNDPGEVQPDYYDEFDDTPHDHGIGWDLSWDCRVSFGYQDNRLHACVSTSGAERRNGITVRTITPNQLRAFAAQLVALADLGTAVEDARAEASEARLEAVRAQRDGLARRCSLMRRNYIDAAHTAEQAYTGGQQLLRLTNSFTIGEALADRDEEDAERP